MAAAVKREMLTEHGAFACDRLGFSWSPALRSVKAEVVTRLLHRLSDLHYLLRHCIIDCRHLINIGYAMYNRAVMDQELEISFDIRGDHWLIIYLDSQNQHLELAFPYTPLDILSELICALLKVLDGLDSKVICGWPEGYEFIFVTRRSKTQLEVRGYDNKRSMGTLSETVFHFRGSHFSIPP